MSSDSSDNEAIVCFLGEYSVQLSAILPVS
jgi:hypothetical protein